MTYRRAPFVELARLLKERWRTERLHQDIKGELDIDPSKDAAGQAGIMHVSVALACFAFVVAGRTQRFPPWAREEVRTLVLAARTHVRDSFIAFRLALSVRRFSGPSGPAPKPGPTEPEIS